ncbi:MAG: hypothetical protein EOO12_03520 [Chitinophagaceae bacterium]|nr:MAG: hypothetical protein EOO12_03520 [Chitinophagaceae bacterium]
MNALVYNLAGSAIPQSLEADVLRAAYLLAETVDSLGPAIKILEAEAATLNGSLAEKLAFVEAFVTIAQPADGERLVQQMRLLYKNLQKSVQGDAELRSWKRNSLALFNNIHSEIHKALVGSLEGYAIARLAGLLEEKEFGWADVDAEHPESGEGEPLSTLLQLPLTNSDSFFFLPASMLATHALKSVTGSIEAQDRLLRQALYIPALHRLSFDELRHLREKLTPATSAFQGAFLRWLGPPTAADETAGFCPEEIGAALQALQATIDTADLQGPEGMCVYGAALPMTILWEAFAELNALPEPTRARLPFDSPEAARARPVLFVQAADGPPQRHLDLAAVTSARKKSLTID